MKAALKIHDSVRPSRDGHEFHETWVARLALRLVMPGDGFVGIAIEGPSPADQTEASEAFFQIADATLYYGSRPHFEKANRMVVVQVKYSIRKAESGFRAAEAKKTIQKFAASYRDFINRFPIKEVRKKLRFELITNRPISDALERALHGIQAGAHLKGDAKKQAEQFKSACGFKGAELIEFVKRVRFTGMAGSLREAKELLAGIIVNWSVTYDTLAYARLSHLRDLVREKAGLAGEGRNVITRIDVFRCLKINEPEDLLPCRSAFPPIGQVVQRSQLHPIAKRIPEIDEPLLLHAAGGVGKTVLLQSLAGLLSDNHEVVLFDCFGGGGYRAPEDSRHLPKHGLLHIVNSLACKGYCDPLLPSDGDAEFLMKAFRNRLTQVVEMLNEVRPGARLLIFLDAIDNAADQATAKKQDCFPKLILESFENKPIDGIKIIVSCRSHRRDIARGEISCEEIEVEPFNEAETATYMRSRINPITDSQIHVAFARSGGNPRILEHLVTSDRGLLEPSEIQKPIVLDELISKRIESALKEAKRRGYSKATIEAFLGGLAVLPPPVPLEEYADAAGIDTKAVESFAADLTPLLEKTKHGLTFRDEPTETLIKERYAAKKQTLKKLANNLFAKQGVSVYAASALPGLLTRLNDSENLFKLAFDNRFPTAVKTQIGKQHIRHTRLTSSVLLAARKREKGRLVQLLVELSGLAAVNQRGTAYTIDNPDLVVASGDVDAVRRLFETRTPWPGTRHSRLAIAHALSGEVGEATRHARNADEWIRDHNRLGREERQQRQRGPETLDFAAVALCIAVQNRAAHALGYLGKYYDWAAFEIGCRFFEFLGQGSASGTIPKSCLADVLHAAKLERGIIAAAMSRLELDTSTIKQLLVKLASACKSGKTLVVKNDYRGELEHHLQHSLLKSSAIAVSMKQHRYAKRISGILPDQPQDVWSFTDHYSNRQVSLQLIRAATIAAANKVDASTKDVLPVGLALLASRVSFGSTGEAYRKSLKAELEKEVENQKKLPPEKRIHAFDRQDELAAFVDHRLEAVLEITRLLAELLSCPIGKADEKFKKLVELWFSKRTKPTSYEPRPAHLFFDVVGRQIITFVIWSRNDLNVELVKSAVDKFFQADVPLHLIVEVISALAKRQSFQQLAGETAVKAKTLIEKDDDVGGRASILADLSRAILPADRAEAAIYFRAGLEQMDAIGSGDYEFANELFYFASTLKGGEIPVPDFHALANICELSMADPDKFGWGILGRAFAKTGGRKAFSKLARWNDRGKLVFEYSLLPYLKALIEGGKFDPTLATVLQHLAKPVELSDCGTSEFAEELEKTKPTNLKSLISALFDGFERNHPEPNFARARQEHSVIAKRILGSDSSESGYLSDRALLYQAIIEEDNRRINFRGNGDSVLARGQRRKNRNQRKALRAIARDADPLDEQSLATSLQQISEIERSYEVKREFFDEVRKRIPFAKQTEYVKLIAKIENLDIYPKLHELTRCKELWGKSSLALSDTLREIAPQLVRLHTLDLVSNDYFSGHLISEISGLTDTSSGELAIYTSEVFAGNKPNLPAQIWLGLASTINKEAPNGAGQAALQRLLRGGAAKLSSKAKDGPFKTSLYKNDSKVEIAANLIRLGLGSEWAGMRWRAAHTMRIAAKFGCWSLIDRLLKQWSLLNLGPYQAEELNFYHLHAKLWMLIAIARIAKDDPVQILKHRSLLKRIAEGKDGTHVLMRHFAALSLLECSKKIPNAISEKEMKALQAINQSPFPSQKTEQEWGDSFYKARPASLAKPRDEFHLDYDFDKHQVISVANAFGKTHWEVKDEITHWVRSFDTKVKGMHEDGGRESYGNQRFYAMNSEHHQYGQYLGWHGLYVAAGEFLAKFPTVTSQYNENRWSSWFSDQVLSRSDGLWLSDGVDRPPREIQANLLETDLNGVVLTSAKKKILSVLGINKNISDGLVVCGDWESPDDIKVRVSSALLSLEETKKAAMKLAKMAPFQVRLPIYEEDGPLSDPERKKNKGVKWTFRPSVEMHLDQTDPWGASSALDRPYFVKKIQSQFSLRSTDSFNRSWVDSKSIEIANAHAWGRHSHNEHETSFSGERLFCNVEFLQNVLRSEKCDLLLLVVLQRYDKGHSSQPARFWHTTAVVSLNQFLDMKYYPGVSNELHVSKF